MDFNKNPLVEKRNAEYARLPDGTVARMKAVSAEPPKNYQLKAMKRRKNINIQSGDMFAVQAINGTFYVGQVLQSNLPVDEIDPFIEGCHVIVIFDQIISSPDEDVSALPLDYYQLLIKPCIVEDTYWKRGYFSPLIRRPVPSLDSLSYGFWSYRKQAFQTVKGELLERTPKIMGIYGLTTITGVASEMKRALIAKGIV